jgi:hypothetical protein
MHLGHKMSTHYFSSSGGTDTDSIKSVQGHVTLNLFFSSGGICGSCSAFQCVRGIKHRQTIFHARVGSAQLP